MLVLRRAKVAIVIAISLGLLAVCAFAQNPAGKKPSQTAPASVGEITPSGGDPTPTIQQ